MPKFACVCGYVINLSHGTSDCEFILISEKKIDEIGSILSAQELSEDSFYDAISEGAITVYRCSSCGRLHLDEGSNRFYSYIKEVI